MGRLMHSMLSDSHDPDSLSSKRIVTLVAFILIAIAFISDLFFDKTITQAIYDSMVYIVLGGFGFTGLEKFASPNYTKQNKRHDDDDEEEEDDEDPPYNNPAPDIDDDDDDEPKRKRKKYKNC